MEKNLEGLRRTKEVVFLFFGTGTKDWWKRIASKWSRLECKERLRR